MWGDGDRGDFIDANKLTADKGVACYSQRRSSVIDGLRRGKVIGYVLFHATNYEEALKIAVIAHF